MEKQKKIYAVCIGDNYMANDALLKHVWPYNEAIFRETSVTNVKKAANLYRRQWQITDEKIQYIREISEEEYNERNAADYGNAAAGKYGLNFVYINGYDINAVRRGWED